MSTNRQQMVAGFGAESARTLKIRACRMLDEDEPILPKLARRGRFPSPAPKYQVPQTVWFEVFYCLKTWRVFMLLHPS